MPAIKLRWGGHSLNLLGLFESFLASETLVDITLAAEGKFLRAHRVILCACSPFFQELVSTLDKEKHPIVFLKGFKFSQLQALINFIYRGEIEIPSEELPALLSIAEELKIRGITDQNESSHDNPSTSMPPPRPLGSESQHMPISLGHGNISSVSDGGTPVSSFSSTQCYQSPLPSSHQPHDPMSTSISKPSSSSHTRMPVQRQTSSATPISSTFETSNPSMKRPYPHSSRMTGPSLAAHVREMQEDVQEYDGTGLSHGEEMMTEEVKVELDPEVAGNILVNAGIEDWQLEGAESEEEQNGQDSGLNPSTSQQKQHRLLSPGTAQAGYVQRKVRRLRKAALPKPPKNRNGKTNNKGKNYTMAQKEQAVRLLQMGYSCRQVAGLMGPGCSSGTPIRWKQEFERLERRRELGGS